MHNSIAEKVLQATDIVEVVQEHVSLARKGKEYVGLCPFHPDHKPSMQVSPKKQIFKCFACGAGGDALKFIQMRQRVAFGEALSILASRAGISVGTSEADRRADQVRDQIRQAVAWARSHFQRNLHHTAAGKAALDYALGRGLTAETIERHGLGYAADSWDDLLRAAVRTGITEEILHQAGLVATSDNGKIYDRFRHRLTFPINDALGRPVAFGGRTLGNDQAKYLNSPETVLFSKSRVLYGLDLARESIEQRREAIVVEGYMDAVLVHQFGFPHAVATLGTAMTDAHAKLLRSRADQVILCFDGDEAGMRAADRAVEVSLVGGMDVRVAVLDAGMDPADCVLAHGAEGFEKVLRAAADALEFKWSLMCRAFGDGSPRTRRAAVEAMVEFAAAVAASGGIDPLQEGLLVRRLSELLALPTEAVYSMLGAARRPARPTESAGAAALAERSTYAESIRGLPAGLTAAVETLFGLLVVDANCVEHAGEQFAQAVNAGEAWQRLYAVIRKLVEAQGGYVQADVIERCEDAAVCELVGQACARVRDIVATQEAFRAAHERLVSEWNTLRMGDLQRDLGREAANASTADQTFGRLLATARGQDFALATATRLNARTIS